jgi:hypothetical protein
MGDWPIASAAGKFLDRLDCDNKRRGRFLTTIRDNEVCDMIGNFRTGRWREGAFGSGWWHVVSLATG